MARTPREILFRLRQEATNLHLFLRPKEFWGEPSALPLPDPAACAVTLKDSSFAACVVDIAEASLKREFRILGYTIHTGPEIRWRKDYVHGQETGLQYFRRIPYLNAEISGDHKIIWELNRHQHLVASAQAHLFTGRRDFLDDIWLQLDSWIEQNPPSRGMNWTSALEVAFRALSWIWIYHLVGKQAPEPFRRRWLTALYQHGHYLASNLSVYFSPNTHLQGEALALHAAGLFFDVEAWRRIGATILDDCIRTHIRDDGSHFEQSSYYHVYAVDMFLLYAVLAPVSLEYRVRLKRALGYLWALASSGEIPCLGDDDGGRLFHPYGPRRAFARATLASGAHIFGDTSWHGDPRDLEEQAVWWLKEKNAPAASPAPTSALYSDAGIAILVKDDIQAIVDTRAFGFGGAGHSHAHALHFTLRRGGQDVLIDPGTYTYVGDPAARDLFRGTRMHNTVLVDGLNQATPQGPFRWRDLPRTKVLHWSAEPWRLEAQCEYHLGLQGIRHVRHMALVDDVLFVFDSFTGAGEHRLEQMWHPGGEVRSLGPELFELPGQVLLALPENSQITHSQDGWYSPVPGVKHAVPTICVSSNTILPSYFGAAFSFDSRLRDVLRVELSNGQAVLTLAGRSAQFQAGF